MANTDNNTVQLDISAESKYLEGLIESVPAPPVSCYPGALMLVTGTDPMTVIPHDQVDFPQDSIFAVEDIYRGSDINTSYALNERVYMRQCRRGDLVLAWLVAGETISVGDRLSSSADGVLHIAPTPTMNDDVIVGVAEEAVISGVVPARIIIRVS